MILWTVFALLALVALGFVVWPLYRDSKRLTATLAAVVVLVVGGSAGLYAGIGSPGVPSGADALPDVDQMVASLEARMKETPDDINGWLMLGRSYQTLKRYDEAIVAFETAIEREQGRNAETLVALAIVLLEQQGGNMPGRAADLFESALAIDPNNMNALFYGGGAAARRGNTALAADRWERLLGLDAPPEVQELLQRKINEWRGLPAPVAPQAPPPLVTVDLSISEEAGASLPADATVYLIARDPAQPSPPIAVKPLRLSQLPMQVSLSDSDSMMQNRALSAFADIEIVARVSVSGSPMAQSGDWSGSIEMRAGDSDSKTLVIDQQVP